MRILRVGSVAVVLALLGVSAIRSGLAVESGAKAKPSRSVTSRPAPKALTPAQQKQAEAAKKQFAAARSEYEKLRQSGAPEEKLAAPRAKMVKAQQELKALGVTPRPRRLSDGSGCSTSGGCGGKDEAKGGGCAMGGKHHGGCSMGDSCSMGAKGKPSSHSTTAKGSGGAGKSTKQAASQAHHASGRSGAAVERGSDAAGHDGGHSAHGGAAQAQGIRPIGVFRLGTSASMAGSGRCQQDDGQCCCGEDCQGCCNDCGCCDGEHGVGTSTTA